MESLVFTTISIFTAFYPLQDRFVTVESFPFRAFQKEQISHRYAITLKVSSVRHNTTVLLGFFESTRAKGGKGQGKRKEKVCMQEKESIPL